MSQAMYTYGLHVAGGLYFTEICLHTAHALYLP